MNAEQLRPAVEEIKRAVPSISLRYTDEQIAEFLRRLVLRLKICERLMPTEVTG